MRLNVNSYSCRSCKSSYSTRAADASPRRSANPTTLRTRTLRSSPIVSTSPALTGWPGAISRTPLMRTWPASTSAAALVRAFTTRACHNHLSRRWRSKQHQFEQWIGILLFLLTRFLYANRYPPRIASGAGFRLKRLAVLAVGGELLLESSQFGKRRIGVDRTLALARRGAGSELPGARPADWGFVSSPFFASALLAPALEFTLVPALALKTLARRTALVLARFAHRRAIRCRRGGVRRRARGGGEVKHC